MVRMMKKRFLAVLCAVALLVCALPFHTFANASSVSFLDWKQSYGAWSLKDGAFSLTNDYRSLFSSVLQLDFMGRAPFENHFGANFTIDLPTRNLSQEERVSVQVFVYDPQAGQYTSSMLYYGAVDVFATAAGLGQTWVAGSWCDFGGTPSYDCSVAVNGKTVTWQVGPYSAEVDLTSAQWTQGVPPTSFRLEGIVNQDYTVKNIVITGGGETYDYTGITSEEEKVLLIGHSHMQMWPDFYETLGNSAVVSNCAIGGTTISHWDGSQPWSFAMDSSGFMAEQPDKMVLAIGNNDLSIGKSVEQTAQEIEAYLLLWKLRSPNTKLYYVENIPYLYGYLNGYMDKILELNAIMKTWCANNGVAFIGLAAGYLNEDGTPDESLYTLTDGEGNRDTAHPNYSYWNTVVPSFVQTMTPPDTGHTWTHVETHASDFSQLYGGWRIQDGKIELADRSDGGWSGTANYWLDLPSFQSNDFVLQFSFERPKEGATENGCYLHFDDGAGAQKQFILQWGSGDVFITPQNFIMGDYLGLAYTSRDRYTVTLTVKDGVVTASISNGETKSVAVADCGSWSIDNAAAIRFRGINGLDFKVDNITITDYQNYRYYDYTRVSTPLPQGFSPVSGSWSYLAETGNISLDSTDEVWYDLAYTGSGIEQGQIRFDVSLPANSAQEERSRILFNVVDKVNNRYLPVELHVGHMDAFARYEGQDEISCWLAGAWGEFGVNQKVYPVTVDVSQGEVAFQIEGFERRSLDLTAADAAWVSGVPAQTMLMGSRGSWGISIGNFQMDTPAQLILPQSYEVKGSYITKIPEGTTVEAFTADCRVVNGTMRVVQNGQPVSSGVVTTGTLVQVMQGDEVKQEWFLVVYGDVTGDGIVNAGDIIAAKRHILKTEILEGAYLEAANATQAQTPDISVLDLVAIKRRIAQL